MMKYDIAFLSRIIPNDIDDEVRPKMIGLMDDAAMAWQWHVIEGIEINTKGPVKMINILPMDSYPKHYKDPFVHQLKFSHKKDADDISLGYCNIQYIKRFVQWMPMQKELTKWVEQDNGCPKVLIAYTMYPEFLRAFKFVKSRKPNIKTINVVVDLPQFIMLERNKAGLLARLYEKWSCSQASDNIQYVDGFVPITKQMAELLSPTKPYRIVEGLSTTQFPEPKPKTDNVKRVLYAGKLHEVFGIMTLLDAFSLIQNQNIELIICGIGESEDELKRRSQNDRRIHFLGQLKRERVLELIVDSDVVVNPRQNKGEYTKYSFPSKDIEALSSGTPFIGYKLDGITDEYDEYINYPEDDSAEALAKLIEDVCFGHAEKYSKLAQKAKEWINSEKSCASQGKKIVELIERLLNDQ